MKGCTDNQKLYQLPGFFAQAAAVLSSDRNSQFFVSEVFFPKPNNGLVPPAPASEIWESLGKSASIDEKNSWNEYGEALKQVSYLTGREERRVVLLLTDGTFTQQPGRSKEEEQKAKQQEMQEIEQELRNLKEQKNAEVYLIFCNRPGSLEAWESPITRNMLSGTYGVDKLSEWIDDLGNALFGEWLNSSENIQMGWITSTSTVALPGETITFSADIVPLDSGATAWIDHMGRRFYLHYDDDKKVFTFGKESFGHSKPAGYHCEPREIRLNLENSVGLYLIRAYRTPLVEGIQVETSVNHQPATVTFSLKASPDFEPSDFVQCYSGMELTSRVANIFERFQNSRSTLIWQPLTQTEPGDHPGTLYLKNREGRVLAAYSITLPARFQPTPLYLSETAEVVRDPSQGDLYRMDFEYKYVPPGVRPQIFLCSSRTPAETEEVNTDHLACGKATCCGGGKCNIVCPTPTPCPPEVSNFCMNCVPVVFSDLCASEKIAVASQHPDHPQFTQIYTVTLYKCPAEESEGKCGYTGLLFFWPEGPKVVTALHYFSRSGNAWILQQP